MKSLIKQRLEAIEALIKSGNECEESEEDTAYKIWTVVASDLEREKDISRLEGMIEGFRLGFHPQGSDKYDEVITKNGTAT